MELTEAPEQLSAAATMVWAWTLEFLPRFGAAILILVAGVILAGWMERLVRGVAGRTTHIDETVRPILGTVVRYAVLILFLIATLGQLGVQTASLLAVLGAAGLAIGLALQGTLANIAAGVMLIYLRPFRVGDYIEVENIAGTVKEIGLFVTHLETWDGLFLFAPNSKIWDRPLKNHTRNAVRLINIVLEISYGSDPAVARRVLLDLADDDPRVLKDPSPYVYVENYGDKGVKLTFRAWAPNRIYWDVHRALIEEAKRRLEAAGIDIAFPHRIVHVVPEQESAPPPPGAAAGASREKEAQQ